MMLDMILFAWNSYLISRKLTFLCYFWIVLWFLIKVVHGVGEFVEIRCFCWGKIWLNVASIRFGRCSSDWRIIWVMYQMWILWVCLRIIRYIFLFPSYVRCVVVMAVSLGDHRMRDVLCIFDGPKIALEGVVSGIVNLCDQWILVDENF